SHVLDTKSTPRKTSPLIHAALSQKRPNAAAEKADTARASEEINPTASPFQLCTAPITPHKENKRLRQSEPSFFMPSTVSFASFSSTFHSSSVSRESAEIRRCRKSGSSFRRSPKNSESSS